MKNLRILGLFTFIILCWGLAWPINKIGLAYMSPAWYTAIRLMVGTGTMMTIVIVFGKFSLPKPRDFPLIISIGMLQISIYLLLANLGLAYLPAGRSTLLAYTGILVTGISYWSGLVINRELPTIVVSLGLLMVPVVSLIISSIYMNEVISLPVIFAMALIITGIYCVSAKTSG